MIQVAAAGFTPFLAAFTAAGAAGAVPLPVGGNEFLLAEDTSQEIVDRIAGIPDVAVTGRPAPKPPAKKHTRTSGSKE